MMAIKQTTWKLKNLKTFDDFVIDIMNFDKIFMNFFFWFYYCLCGFDKVLSNVQKYKSFLCLILNEIVIYQWQKTIQQYFNLILILIFKNWLFDFNFIFKWVLIIAMKKILQNFDHWFFYLKWIFNQKDF